MTAAFTALGAAVAVGYFAILRASIGALSPGNARMGRFWLLALARIALLASGFVLAFKTGLWETVGYLAGFFIVRTVVVMRERRALPSKAFGAKEQPDNA
jgi:hypothetical protein